MRIYYVTLNTADEASQISRALLEQRLAVCTNWFPITCAYREEEKIVEEAEMVLIVKTHAEYRSAVEQVIRQHISYTNFFAEITPEYVNDTWLQWLNNEVPAKSGGGSNKSPWRRYRNSKSSCSSGTDLAGVRSWRKELEAY